MTPLAERSWRDVVLVVFGGQFALMGLWATASPEGFYDTFPGAGRQWLVVDGPYNEHLMRDVGGLWLGVAAVCAWALWRHTPELRRAAGLALLLSGVPHVIYHATNTAPYGTVDLVASVGGLVVIAVAALAVVVRPGTDTAAT